LGVKRRLVELVAIFALSIFIGPENARTLWELLKLIMLRRGITI
jgi:hypothetical protein